MPEMNGFLILLALATSVDGLLAGASLDQSIKQLPARHRIGMRAFSAYSRASDQGNGFFWYVPLGVGGALLTIAVASGHFCFSCRPVDQFHLLRPEFSRLRTRSRRLAPRR